MKNLKKVLALVMAFAMAFTMMAGAAYTDQDDIQATDAVELLATLNVMTGKGDGMFHPNDTITRAEICRIIYTIRNDGNSNADAYADMQTTFQDLTSADDWAKGYIKHCQSVGLISGRNEAGTVFGPQDPVTGVELAVICLRVLGYDPAKAGIGGESWSTRTVGLANEAGLLKNVNMESVTGPCERQWAAQIMANMLDAYTVRWSTDGDQYTTMGVDNTRNPKVGKEYMKLDSDIGLLTAIDKENIVINIKSVDAPDSFHGAGNQTFTKVPKDYSELLGQKVKVLFHNEKNNDVIGVYPVEGNTVYTVAANGVEKDNDERIKFGGNTYPVTRDGIATYIDGKEVAETTTVDKIDNNNLNPNMYTLVDSDDDGRIDTLIVKTYNVAKVSYAASDRIIANGTTYRHADENIAEGIAKDDWVVITKNLYDDCYDIVKADVATGRLSGLRQETNAKKLYYDGQSEITGKTYNEYQIDNAWYFGGGTAPLQDTKLSQNDINSVQAGNNVEFVAVNNIMFYIKRVSGNANGRVDNAAMVVARDDAGGASPRVKIAFFDGTTEAVEVKVDNSLTLAQLKPGVVYEFDKSGNQYKFYPLKDQNEDKTDKYKNYYGDLSFNGTNASEDSYYTGIATTKLENINSLQIADDAQVLLYHDANDDSKKITGKQFKTLDPSRYNAKKYYAFHGDMDGLDRIGALAITIDNLNNLGTSYSHYGYIVQDAYRISGASRISYTIWNGKENVVVEEAVGNTSNRSKGTVIGYDTIKEENSVNVIDDVTPLTDDNITFTAITSLNTNKTKAVFADSPVGVSNSRTELDIVADKVFYINSDADNYENIGIVEGTLGVATKDSDGNWRANALVIGNDDEIELLIFDVGEYLDNAVYHKGSNANGSIGGSGSNNTTSTTAVKEVAVDAAKNVTIAFDVLKGATKLTVNYVVRVNGIIAGHGTASVEGTGNNKITVTDTEASFTLKNLTPVPASKNDVEVVLKDLTYTEFAGNAPVSNINDALKQGNIALNSTSTVPADAKFEVPKNTTLDMTAATVATGAKVNVEAGGIVKVMSNSQNVTIGETVDGNGITADCPLTVEKTATGIEITSSDANGTITVNGNYDLETNGIVITLKKGQTLVGVTPAAGATSKVAAEPSKLTIEAGSIVGAKNFYLYGSTTAVADSSTLSGTFIWTTDKWVKEATDAELAQEEVDKVAKDATILTVADAQKYVGNSGDFAGLPEVIATGVQVSEITGSGSAYAGTLTGTHTLSNEETEYPAFVGTGKKKNAGYVVCLKITAPKGATSVDIPKPEENKTSNATVNATTDDPLTLFLFVGKDAKTVSFDLQWKKNDDKMGEKVTYTLTNNVTCTSST